MNIPFKRLSKQRICLKDKLANNKQWAKDIIDSLCLYGDDILDTENNEYSRMLSNYLLYNNVLDQKDFERECNPLGIEVGQFKDQILPYNKTYNKIQVLLGEELKRNIEFRAVLINEEGIKEKELKKSEMLIRWAESYIEILKNRIIENSKKLRGEPDISNIQNEEEIQKIMQDYNQSLMNDSEKILNPEEIETYMSVEYRDVKEIAVQKVLNWLWRDMDIKNKMNDAFKHACISARELCWVGIENGNSVVRVLNPLHTFFHKSPEIKYIQDGEYAGTRYKLTTADVLNIYEEDLSEEDKDRIENIYNSHHNNFINPTKDMQYHNLNIQFEYKRGTIYDEGSYGYASDDTWDIYHLEWVSRGKVGFYTYFDDNGDEVTDIVSEDFPLPEGTKKVSEKNLNNVSKTIHILPDGSKLEWKWIPEVWEGTRIGSDIYVNIRKKSVQYRSIDNPFKVKLGYHGCIYNNMNAPEQSIMDRMKPYQYLYFIIMHKMKKLIARDRGQVMPFDLSMVDEKIGLEKTLYYLEEMDIDMYNSLMNSELPGSSHRGKLSHAINRSNMQHILNYISLLRQIDYEIGEAAGVNKQREGQIGTYETIGNAQQSLTQSAYITEIFFYQHFKNWEKIMDSLVQCTQYAWKGEKIIKQFVMDDLSRHILNIDGDQLYNSDFGIYISNNLNDIELISILKQMALPILQNSGKITDIIRIYKSLSASEIEREFEKYEREKERHSQQAQEAQRQALLEQIQAEQQSKIEDREHELKLKQMELETKIQIEAMKIQQKAADLDADNNGISDFLEMQEMQRSLDLKEKELEFKKQKHKDNIRLEEKKVNLKK